MLLLPALTAWPQLQFYLKDDEPSTDVSDEESVFAINGKRIVLERTSLPNRTSAHHEAQTSCTVWDASLVLAKYLERACNEGRLDLSRKRIVELGSGQGIVGIAAALLNAQQVVLTDLPDVCSNLQRQLAANHLLDAFPVSSLPMDWHHPEECIRNIPLPINIILGADIVWMENLVEPLVRTLSQLAGSNSIQIYLAHQSRSSRTDNLFMELLKQYGFEPTIISRDEHDLLYRRPEIDIYHITRCGATISTASSQSAVSNVER